MARPLTRCSRPVPQGKAAARHRFFAIWYGGWHGRGAGDRRQRRGAAGGVARFPGAGAGHHAWLAADLLRRGPSGPDRGAADDDGARAQASGPGPNPGWCAGEVPADLRGLRLPLEQRRDLPAAVPQPGLQRDPAVRRAELGAELLHPELWLDAGRIRPRRGHGAGCDDAGWRRVRRPVGRALRQEGLRRRQSARGADRWCPGAARFRPLSPDAQCLARGGTDGGQRLLPRLGRRPAVRRASRSSRRTRCAAR